MKARPLSTGEKTWSYLALLFVAVCALAVGLWARLYALGAPPVRVFDEVYFPVFARDYLRGVPFFDVHPPLGKLLLVPSIALFGDTPFVWRLTPAFFGLASMGLGAALGWYYLKERVGALLMATFVASETMLIAYSRVALLDGILLFFVLATVLTAWRAERKRHVVLAAVLFGLTVSIKWASLGVIVPTAYILWRKRLLKPFLASLGISLAVYLLIVFAGQVFSGDEAPLRGLLNWHREAYHAINSPTTHPWSSRWWSWPLMLRPLAFFFEERGPGGVVTIYALGNPILFWGSTLAVLFGLYEMVRRKVVGTEPILDHPLMPVLLGYMALLFPWALSGRASLIYHYLPAYGFALLALAYGMSRCWRYRPWLVVALAACALAIAVFFLPMAMGLPMSQDGFQRRVWMNSWL